MKTTNSTSAIYKTHRLVEWLPRKQLLSFLFSPLFPFEREKERGRVKTSHEINNMGISFFIKLWKNFPGCTPFSNEYLTEHI